jgi:hypothetical protein
VKPYVNHEKIIIALKGRKILIYNMLMFNSCALSGLNFYYFLNTGLHPVLKYHALSGLIKP